MPTHSTGPKNSPSPTPYCIVPQTAYHGIKEVSHDTDHWAVRMIVPLHHIVASNWPTPSQRETCHGMRPVNRRVSVTIT
jgi:hypothetical protein